MVNIEYSARWTNENCTDKVNTNFRYIEMSIYMFVSQGRKAGLEKVFILATSQRNYEKQLMIVLRALAGFVKTCAALYHNFILLTIFVFKILCSFNI